MDVYLVVPETTNVSTLRAPPGWRVFVSLGKAIGDIEERYRVRDRGRGGGMARGSSPVPVVTHIPDELFYEHCSCEMGSVCSHSPWLIIDEVNLDEPLLKQALGGWRRVTQDDFTAWSIEQKLLGVPMPRHRRSPWDYKDYWFHRMPPSEPAPKEAIVPKHGLRSPTTSSRRTATGR